MTYYIFLAVWFAGFIASLVICYRFIGNEMFQFSKLREDKQKAFPMINILIMAMTWFFTIPFTVYLVNYMKYHNGKLPKWCKWFLE